MRGEYEYRSEILDLIQYRLDGMIDSYCKVLAVRFDVRFPVGYCHDGGNREISQLIKSLKEYYTEHSVAIHYVWVREQVSSLVPHYHVVLFVNGSRIQDARGIWSKAQDIWSRITGGPNGLIHHCWPGYQDHTGIGGIMIRRPSGRAVAEEALPRQQQFEAAKQAAIEQAAYLAKTYSKGNTPYRVREYGASQL